MKTPLTRRWTMILVALLMVPVAVAQTARVQVVHNAADPAASVVDIYVNGDIFLDDFVFRTATPFVDVPAEVELLIGVAPGDSDGAEDALAEFPVTLADGERYVVIANGVLTPRLFYNNPARLVNFRLFVKPMAREAATDPDNVDFFAVHGSTDAPVVDVIARDVGILVDDLVYSDITDYLSVPPARYTIDVTPGAFNNTIVASYTADLSGLAGGAAAVIASGFLTPDDDQNGPPFALLAVLPDGTVLELPPAAASRPGLTQRGPMGLRPGGGAATLRSRAYPNPFNPTTTLSFDLPNAADVSVAVYNTLGQQVMAVPVQSMASGSNQSIRLDASALPSGVYLYRVTAVTADQTLATTGRLLLMK